MIDEIMMLEGVSSLLVEMMDSCFMVKFWEIGVVRKLLGGFIGGI
jgi:hypothetical protein